MKVKDNFIFDIQPFKDLKNNIFDYILDGWKIDIKHQINIISDIIFHVYNDNVDHKKNFFIYGSNGTGKSFILNDIERFLLFRKESVLFLNPELFSKFKKKLLHNNIKYKYIIFDDLDKVKDIDKKQLQLIVGYNSKLIFSSSKIIKNTDLFYKENTKIYKLYNLSFFETYSYINKSVNLSYGLNANNKKIFSLLAIFFIYIFSMGKLYYINKISTFCLNLFIQNKLRVISYTHVLRYLKKNLKTIHNAFKLFFKCFIVAIFILIVTFLGYKLYLCIHRAKFNRIRQEIELQNLKDYL